MHWSIQLALATAVVVAGFALAGAVCDVLRLASPPPRHRATPLLRVRRRAVRVRLVGRDAA